MPAPFRVPRPRRRRGCLGGCLVPIVGLLVAGAIFVLALRAVFTPWSYFLGGRFHAMPAWVGVGHLHAGSGDFALWLELEPTSQNRLGYPGVSGHALLVDPKGERFQMSIVGGFLDRWIGLVPEGRGMWLHLLRVYPGLTINPPERRPRFDLRGDWHGDELRMTDHGSLSRAFLPDGRAYLGPTQHQPATRETLSVTIRQCPWSEYLRVRFALRP